MDFQEKTRKHLDEDQENHKGAIKQAYRGQRRLYFPKTERNRKNREKYERSHRNLGQESMERANVHQMLCVISGQPDQIKVLLG